MLTTQQVFNMLKLSGYVCEICEKPKSRIIVKTDNLDRISVLKEIENMFSIQSGVNAFYDTKISGSTIGGVRVDRTTIFVKPNKRASSVHYEITEINNLNKKISSILEQSGCDYVTIKYKNNLYNVVRVEKTPGTPKSDFHFIDVNGNECLWISHKAGTTPKDFQQWSGMSASLENAIFTHKESKAFVNDLYMLYPNKVMPNRTSVMKSITDNKLKKMAVYGSGYNGVVNNEGRNNVCYVLQGNVELKPIPSQPNIYTIEAFHKYENGDDITGSYEPVMSAIYKGDRPNFGIRGLRAGILPITSRTWTTKLK